MLKIGGAIRNEDMILPTHKDVDVLSSLFKELFPTGGLIDMVCIHDRTPRVRKRNAEIVLPDLHVVRK